MYTALQLYSCTSIAVVPTLHEHGILVSAKPRHMVLSHVPFMVDRALSVRVLPSAPCLWLSQGPRSMLLQPLRQVVLQPELVVQP